MNKRISSEIGILSLLCIGLFFMSQIICLDTNVKEAYASINIISTIPSTATLNVEMLKTEMTEIEKGTNNVLLVAAELSNPGAQDLTVSELYISGVFSTLNEINTDLYVDDARYGEPDLVQDNIVGYNTLSLKIPAGKSVKLVLEGDILETNAQTPLTYYFTSHIAAYDSLGTRASVKMVGNASASILNIKEKGATTSSSFNINFLDKNIQVSKGDKNVELQKMFLKNDLNQTAIIEIVDFDIVSSGSYLDDTNLDVAYLYLDDKLFAIGSIKNNKAIFNTIVAVSAGSSKTLTLKGDISAATSARLLSLKMNWEYNVYYGGVTVHTPVNMTGSSSVITIYQGSISSAIDYDIAGSFAVMDFAYDPSSNKIFSQTATLGEVYQAKFNGDSDNTFTTTNRYCGWDGNYYDSPNGWQIERKFVSANKYRVTVFGISQQDCGLGQPQNTGWFKLNPNSGWKITETVKCKVNEDNNSNGKIIETYCTVNKDTGEVKWQSGSMCGGCCACSHGAVVDIEVVVEKTGYDSSLEEDSSQNTEIVCNNDQDIKEGSMIRLKGGIDVYIVKYANCKRFKRLILSPSVFRSYGHLKWENIIDVDQATLDSYTTSNYVRVLRENAYWQLEPQGDNGVRKKIMNLYRWDEAASGWAFILDPDSVYEINDMDRDSYLQK